MTDADIERLAAEFIAEDWTPDRYYRDMNLIAFANKLLEHGYADGRKDERESGLAAMDAWVATQGKPRSLPETMTKDEMLAYYSSYSNLCAHEALQYQRRIRELESALASEQQRGRHDS